MGGRDEIRFGDVIEIGSDLPHRRDVAGIDPDVVLAGLDMETVLAPQFIDCKHVADFQRSFVSAQNDVELLIGVDHVAEDSDDGATFHG